VTKTDSGAAVGVDVVVDVVDDVVVVTGATLSDVVGIGVVVELGQLSLDIHVLDATSYTGLKAGHQQPEKQRSL
jgi:hypothetical protein